MHHRSDMLLLTVSSTLKSLKLKRLKIVLLFFRTLQTVTSEKIKSSNSSSFVHPEAGKSSMVVFDPSEWNVALPVVRLQDDQQNGENDDDTYDDGSDHGPGI